MGSSKKHKEKDKDHKRKKKHRSRSRSRERKHKKDKREDKHDKRVKRERDGDDEHYFEEGEIPGLDLVSVKKEEPAHEGYEEYGDYLGGADEAGEGSGTGGGESSLSIEETNRLRAKLGLKPLDVGGGKAEENDDTKPVKKEDIHVPAANLTEIKKTEKLRQKMEQIREKRKLNQKLGKVKTIGESDEDDDSALAWINKSRKMQREKEEAEKRAKMLDDMDEEFGISGLLDEEFADTKKAKEYGSKDLRGLTVEHGQETFTEGKTVILTLKDKGVLDDENDDVLMNVNMADDERYKESVENKKKKPAYNPYDDSQIDEFGMHKPRDVLDKYDEEIDGKRKEKFQLGSGGQYDAQHERQMKKFKEDVAQRGETLILPSPSIASEFYTEQEMASFKKTKKKVRKIRKKPKVVTADDLIPLDSQEEIDHGSRGTRRKRPHEEDTAAIPGLDLVAMEVDDRPVLDESDILGPEEDLTGVPVEDDAMNDLQSALSKARKLKRKKRIDPEKKVLQHVREVGMEEGSDDDGPSGSKLPGVNIVLNSTSEFCRTLGDIPTYGQAGNREEDEEELLDFERELAEERRRKLEEEEMGATGWMSVEIDETPVDIAHEEKGPLDEEPMLNSGIASALQLGLKKGYFEQEKLKKISAPKHKVLEAKNYSIEDKRYDDLDEKYNKRRDRFGSGVTMEFKDLNHYKPEIKIDYIDESGRNLNQKEAFRALSHRFHGKGSGKRKQEKRSKKLEQENLLMQASSTDTPLGTVAMLQEKQKQEKTPYIVLSGSNKGMTASTLTKS